MHFDSSYMVPKRKWSGTVEKRILNAVDGGAKINSVEIFDLNMYVQYNHTGSLLELEFTINYTVTLNRGKSFPEQKIIWEKISWTLHGGVYQVFSLGYSGIRTFNLTVGFLFPFFRAVEHNYYYFLVPFHLSLWNAGKVHLNTKHNLQI